MFHYSVTPLTSPFHRTLVPYNPIISSPKIQGKFLFFLKSRHRQQKTKAAAPVTDPPQKTEQLPRHRFTTKNQSGCPRHKLHAKRAVFEQHTTVVVENRPFELNHPNRLSLLLHWQPALRRCRKVRSDPVPKHRHDRKSQETYLHSVPPAARWYRRRGSL